MTSFILPSSLSEDVASLGIEYLEVVGNDSIIEVQVDDESPYFNLICSQSFSGGN